MSIPDAPWVGNCREDYYGYDEDEGIVRCECCDEEILEEDSYRVNGDVLCKTCYDSYYSEEERW